jgi:aspartyl-tRNA(Asn)/glutamyl-tRNA(Gln) amidotransferase subunit A
MSQPADLSLHAAMEAISSGDLSPLELTHSCLDRIERLEPIIRAFITLDVEGALRQAATLTEELAGRGSRGPLHGIPIGVKDLIDVEGLPTTAASRILAGTRANVDAVVVARLRSSGSVILGKTNMHEFAHGVVTPPTRNPWDVQRIPGGSSGGSAAATSVGGCLGALGTDTAGSVRIPASLCGVSGLKPRAGTVPTEGIIPLSWTLDSCGPIAGSAVDLDHLWRAMTDGPERGEAPKLRLATPDTYSGVVDLDPEIEDAVMAAVDVLVTEGASRHVVDIPRFDEWDSARAPELLVEALVAHKEAGWWPDRAADYEDETRSYMEYAETIPGARLISARRKLAGLKERFLAAFDDADVLAVPTTSIPAPTFEEANLVVGKLRRPAVEDLTRICGPVNWCELAAVTVPCGLTSNGLPIGLQLLARDEATALTAAARFQSATDHHERRPQLVEDLDR